MFRWLAVLLCACGAVSFAQDVAGPDVAEPGSIEAIAAATGDSRFLSPWVSYLPQSSSVPSPLAFCGADCGSAGRAGGNRKPHAYCRALTASPRVRVFTIGRSEEGREILMLAVADEAGIRDLDRLKAATAALADPRRTDPAAADNSSQPRVRSTTSTPRCIRTKPGPRKRRSSWRIDSRCQTSR